MRDSIQTKNIQALTEAIKSLTREVNAITMDLRERFASLEARVPRL